MRLSILAFSACAFALSANAGVLEDKADRFTGSRAVQWLSVPSEEGKFSLSASAYYLKGSSRPDGYTLRLVTWSARGRYTDCHHSNWLVDGVAAPNMDFGYTSSAAGSATMESFSLRTQRDTLERLSAAKVLEFQVCGTEGVVSAEDLSGMRKVLDGTR